MLDRDGNGGFVKRGVQRAVILRGLGSHGFQFKIEVNRFLIFIFAGALLMNALPSPFTLRAALGFAFLPAVLIAVPSVLRGQDANTEKLSASYIPASGIAVVEMDPSAILNAPEFRLMPIEVADAWLKENVGPVLSDLTSAKIIVGAPGPFGPQMAAVFQFKSDFELGATESELFTGEAVEIDGFTAFPIPDTPDFVAHQPNRDTLIVANGSYLAEVLAAESGKGPLASFVNRISRISSIMIVMVTDPIREQVRQIASQAPPEIPGVVTDLMTLPELCDGLVIAMDMGLDAPLRAVFVSATEEDAEEIESIIENGLVFARDMMVGQSMQSIEGSGPVPEAMRQYAVRLGDEMLQMLKPRRAGNRVILETQNPLVAATPGIAIGLLLPAVQAAREAARRTSSANNLKQILLAFHNHEATFRQFPSNIYDEDGNALLSWRVKILPFIEEMELYDSFHLDEPWDSEHNIKLLERMPAIYEANGIPTEPFHTIYQVPSGEGMLFDGTEGPRFRDVIDGTSNTIAVFESSADKAVAWSKPEDVEIDMRDPSTVMGKERPGIFQVGMADGSVRAIAQGIALDVLRAMLTRAGGEVVNF